MSGDHDVADVEGKRDLTDFGNAIRFVRDHGAWRRYVPSWRCWMTYDGRRWVRDEVDQVRRDAWDTINKIADEEAIYLTGQGASRKRELLKHAVKSLDAHRIQNMLQLAQAHLAQKPSDFDATPHLLNCQNGTLDLQTLNLLEHDSEHLLTKITAVEYDPESHVSEWDGFLKRVIPSDDLRGYTQRVAGASLAGSPTDDVLPFSYGPTGSGKSTFMEAVKHAVGDYAVSADFDTFLTRREVGGARSDLARLKGARLVACGELDSGRKLDVGLVKMISGGDKIVARFLYCPEFEFKPTFVLWFVGNHRPRVPDDEAAFWGRVHVLPFEQTIPESERDTKLRARLQEPNASRAILNWLVEGLRAYLTESGLKPPGSVRNAVEDYRRNMNPLADFVEDRLEAVSDGWESSAKLWAAYQDWRADRREPGEVPADLLGSIRRCAVFIAVAVRGAGGPPCGVLQLPRKSVRARWARGSSKTKDRSEGTRRRCAQGR